MSAMSIPRRGAALIVLLLLASGMPAHATHGDDLHVSGVPDGPFAVGTTTHALTFTITNSGSTGWNKLTLSTNTATEVAKVTGAAATGWTPATPTDSDDPADLADTVVLSGGTLAAGSQIAVTLSFQATAAGTATVTATGDNTGTPAPKSQSFELVFVAPTFTVSGAPTQLSEPSGSATFTVVLGARPTGNVEIGFTAPATAATVKATASSATKLVFTPSNWATAQSATITAVGDYKKAGDRTAAISVKVLDDTSANEYDPLADFSFNVNIVDTDEPNIVVQQVNSAGEPDASTIAYEGGPSDKILVSLATFPETNTKLSVKLDTAGIGQVSVSTSEITFTPTVRHAEVVVSAVEDTIVEALSTSYVITMELVSGQTSSEYVGKTTPPINGQVIDNEGVGITVVESAGATSVSEAAGQRTDTFTVVLDKAPFRTVVVNTVASQTGQAIPEISVGPAQLTFTTSNWHIPQTVTVAAVPDDRPEATETATVRVTINKTLSSGEYHSVADETLSVTILDDDDPAFTVTESGGSTVTTEAGGTDTISVVLAKEPSANVVLKVTSGDTGEIAVTTPSNGQLTFTPANWDTAQTVTLTGQDDALADGHQAVDIDIAVVAASSDPKWGQVPSQTIKATNQDNESVVMAMPANVRITEGESGTYNLSLTVRPTHDVNVAITPGAGVTTDLAKVVFTQANWNVVRSVTVTVPDDAVAAGPRAVTITHKVTSQGNYLNATAQSVSINVDDDDLIDIGAQNTALQSTVKVTRSGSRNTVTWDIAVVEGDPAGVQIWRADSPFFILASQANGTAAYRSTSFTDNGGSADARYVVTVYYGATEELGFFQAGRSTLDEVQGYLGLSQTDMDKLGAASPSEDDNTLLIAAIVFGVLVLAGAIVLIIVLARRRKGDDENLDGDWSGEATPKWTQGTDEAPAQESWTEPTPAETPWDDSDAWSAPADAWGEEDVAQAWPEHQDPKLETFHLTCPRCSHDFSVQGHKPLETQCPNCDVRGVLR